MIGKKSKSQRYYWNINGIMQTSMVLLKSQQYSYKSQRYYANFSGIIRESTVLCKSLQDVTNNWLSTLQPTTSHNSNRPTIRWTPCFPLFTSRGGNNNASLRILNRHHLDIAVITRLLRNLSGTRTCIESLDESLDESIWFPTGLATQTLEVFGGDDHDMPKITQNRGKRRLYVTMSTNVALDREWCYTAVILLVKSTANGPQSCIGRWSDIVALDKNIQNRQGRASTIVWTPRTMTMTRLNTG